ncbi:hypothetical protein [Frigoriflavimonas asaccharolytica]|uniref:Lipoprotein n=1 Tax=Frigoriflavimonas asaccharolytica TaxID=2735899 RepID=A0A8J8K9N8_9FLAO|nr:hypothetical protein [Frigoriflavimonas asaccharolytica]NRS93871.1 hypothetical protein [Frigoriflavimonas asaccharolytica]
MNYVKYITLGLFAIFALQCSAQKETKTVKKELTNTTKNSKIKIVELEEITRGSKRNASISETSKMIVLPGKIKNTPTTKTNWIDVESTINAISLEEINSYPAPTTDRFHDGALAATIKITTSTGKVYTSQTFDAGSPPKELAKLYILLSENFK